MKNQKNKNKLGALNQQISPAVSVGRGALQTFAIGSGNLQVALPKLETGHGRLRGVFP
jgi:hypothetical protein